MRASVRRGGWGGTWPRCMAVALFLGTVSRQRTGPARLHDGASLSAVLITLTCVLVPVSLLTVWVHDIVLDTDRYVSTVSPLATDPAIEAAAVNRITQAAAVRVDGNADRRGRRRLAASPRAATARRAVPIKALGPQLDVGRRSGWSTKVVYPLRRRATASRRIWTNANRAAHAAVVHALTGEGRGAVERERRHGHPQPRPPPWTPVKEGRS